MTEDTKGQPTTPTVYSEDATDLNVTVALEITLSDGGTIPEPYLEYVRGELAIIAVFLAAVSA